MSEQTKRPKKKKKKQRMVKGEISLAKLDRMCRREEEKSKRKSLLSDEDKINIIKLNERGRSKSSIATIYGVSESTIRKAIKEGVQNDATAITTNNTTATE